jgi:hypothetical protein
MTVDEIKKLCRADERLEWWAVTLFAETCALVKSGRYDATHPHIVAKVDEFEKAVIQRALAKADERPSTDERIEALEARVEALEARP